MIEKLKIKEENNEEVLYVYLNYNYEFSKLNLFKNINDYLHNLKIKFTGKKIVLVTSGIVFATLSLSNPFYYKNNLNEHNIPYVSSIIFKNFDNNLNETSEQIYDIEQNETVVNNIQDTSSIENIEIKKSDIINNPIINTKEKIVNKSNSNKNETIVLENNNEIIKNEIKENKIEETFNDYEVQEEPKTMITIHRSNGEILNIELEEYIIGVVAAEMPAAFNIEALKAQSILARTYALKTISQNKTLTDNSSTQNYYDNNKLQSIWGNDYNYYYSKIKQAVDSTKGMVVSYNGSLIEAVYHSTSNGYTESSQNVWGNYFPYLVSVESKYDTNVTSFKKETIFTYEEISNKLGILITQDSIISYEKNESNRVNTIYIDSSQYKGTTFRNLLNLRSTDFELILSDENIIIITKGYGHGVGMSQYGANEMAKLGFNYKDIIYHYYQGVTIN